MTAVQIADTGLQEGQGMHGTLSRDNTFNNMAAIGPDFKQGYVDRLPVANRDIAPTLAYLMGIPLPDAEGRVITEALSGLRLRRHPLQSSESLVTSSIPAANGVMTVLLYQRMGRNLYFDEACFATAATLFLENPCAEE
jgi:hypothetical protein